AARERERPAGAPNLRTRSVRAGNRLRMVFAAAVCAAAGVEAQNGGVSLRVAVATAALRIDGALTEPAWQTADSIAALTQVEPRQGASPSGRTVVRVLATPDAIIVGVRADYPPGLGIVSYARSRDA